MAANALSWQDSAGMAWKKRMNLLLAEDEAISQAFLAEVLIDAGHRVSVAGTGPAALALARQRNFDLLILDLNLPGLRGDQVLRALRDDPAAASRIAPAVALTADLSATQRQTLGAEGFSGAAQKPLSGADLLRVVDGLALSVDARSTSPWGSQAMWDDAAALARTGNKLTILQGLRSLLRKELPEHRRRILSALDAGTSANAQAELHRLRAACGFCGAARLGAISEALERALDQARADSGSLIEEWTVEIDAVYASLDVAGGVAAR